MKLVLTLLATAGLVLAQGPLAPPTAPGPSMKSLDEIWGRIGTVDGKKKSAAAALASNQDRIARLQQQLNVINGDSIPWTINTVDSTLIPGVAGKYTSLAFTPAGHPAVSYYDVSDDTLKYAESNGSTWTLSTVSLPGHGRYCSLAFTPGGQPAISYLSSQLSYSEFDGSSWTHSFVDDGNLSHPVQWSAGYHTSLAFTSAGRPAISYMAGASAASRQNAIVKYAEFDGSTWTGSSVDYAVFYNPVGPDQSRNPGQFTSLAFTPAGQPAVCHSFMTEEILGDHTFILKYSEFDGIDWTRTTVDDGGGNTSVGLYAMLAFTAGGHPAISYYDDTNRDLKYAEFNGSTWAFTTVDSAGDVGRYTSLAFTPGGQPAISYHDITNRNLKFAEFNGSTWTLTTVDSDDDVGEHSSLAFSPAGHPAISYFDLTTGALRVAEFDGNDWAVSVPDNGTSSGDVGLHTSTAFAPTGWPGISYYDASNASLKYAEFNGRHWTSSTIDGQGVGEFTSLAFTSDGRPAISYYASGNLKFAEFDHSSWSTTMVDQVGDVGRFSSLAFTPGGHPAISYYDRGNGELLYAEFDGASWNSSQVAGSLSADKGLHSSLSFTPEGQPAISFYRRYTNVTELFYAEFDGSTWATSFVDGTYDGDVSGLEYATSLAFAPAGRPAISYNYPNNGALKYAEFNGSTWILSTVYPGSSPIGAFFSSLAFLPTGRPAISYYDAANGTLEYAEFDGSNWVATTLDGLGSDAGLYSSHSISPGGHTAISYYDRSHGDLKCAIKAPFPSP